jgi:hypothetical protein
LAEIAQVQKNKYHMISLIVEHKKRYTLLGTVAYAYNPSNSGGRSGEEQFEVSQLS